MKPYCLWKDEEVMKLFHFVESYTLKGKSLSVAFKDYAFSNNRKPNSVRNYYYLELCNLIENTDRAKKLKIDITLHQKKQANFFSQEETNAQMKKILDLKNKGYSIRKACLTVANGNIEQMVRFQNKYRSLLKNNPEYLDQLSGNKTNIISMPVRKQNLTDNEINSLFVGLVKLIKSQARQEANLNIKNEKERANEILRQTLVDLANKEKQLKILRKKFELLKNESLNMSKNIETLRAENAKLLQTDKHTKLKNWTEKNIKKTKKAN